MPRVVADQTKRRFCTCFKFSESFLNWAATNCLLYVKRYFCRVLYWIFIGWDLVHSNTDFYPYIHLLGEWKKCECVWTGPNKDGYKAIYRWGRKLLSFTPGQVNTYFSALRNVKTRSNLSRVIVGKKNGTSVIPYLITKVNLNKRNSKKWVAGHVRLVSDTPPV